jgi:dGTPase
LIKRISSKQIVAYENDLKKFDKKLESYKIFELYHRIRLLTDYVSGMTDDFALEEYKILSAIK